MVISDFGLVGPPVLLYPQCLYLVPSLVSRGKGKANRLANHCDVVDAMRGDIWPGQVHNMR